MRFAPVILLLGLVVAFSSGVFGSCYDVPLARCNETEGCVLASVVRGKAKTKEDYAYDKYYCVRTLRRERIRKPIKPIS